jgi:hypothetical protein
MHREILGLTHGDGKEVDHKNGNRFDNQKINLRVVTHSENQLNRNGANKSYRGKPITSQFRGVASRGKKFVAYGTVKGKRYYLGSYENEEVAAKVAKDFREGKGFFTR